MKGEEGMLAYFYTLLEIAVRIVWLMVLIKFLVFLNRGGAEALMTIINNALAAQSQTNPNEEPQNLEE
jgi:hypothetical protein